MAKPDFLPDRRASIPISKPVPAVENDEDLWQRLEQYLKAGSLIPVLGPGCVAFGKDDQPWLAQQIVARLNIPLQPEVLRSLDLHAVAVTHLAAHGAIGPLVFLESADLAPCDGGSSNRRCVSEKLFSS